MTPLHDKDLENRIMEMLPKPREVSSLTLDDLIKEKTDIMFQTRDIGYNQALFEIKALIPKIVEMIKEEKIKGVEKLRTRTAFDPDGSIVKCVRLEEVIKVIKQ